VKRFIFAIAALLFVGTGAFASTVQFNVTVPGSGTPFDFDSDGTNNWPLVRLWDGTTKMAINPNGTTTEAGSQPVTTPTTTRPLDACYYQTRVTIPISTTAASTTLVTAAASDRVYVCGGMIKNSAAVNIGIIEGGGATCGGGSGGGSTAALAGAITPAIGTAGIPLGGIGDGFLLGDGSGSATIRMLTPNDSLCLVQSGSVLLSGWLSYVQTPF
jgi:hypothetical protein